MRITELPQATSVAQTDDLAIDVPGGRTYKVPRSILAPAPYVVTIPTGQWSGSGSDRYITISASNVTADAMLYPFYDNASDSLLKGPVWTIPADGSFTIHTTAIPAGTVTISVLFAGILGEAQYQVLADVYSKAQTDALVAQSTASKADIVTQTMSIRVVAAGYNTGSGNYFDFFIPLNVDMSKTYSVTLADLVIRYAGTSISTGFGTCSVLNKQINGLVCELRFTAEQTRNIGGTIGCIATISVA